eukprot:GHRR01034307.1.p1 GENE.GHRR01034307.1~~GHRR01034307.1.p1  ORF type:complete len:119 (-),score=30.31 GHRR01034307.1:353-709(-)
MLLAYLTHTVLLKVKLRQHASRPLLRLAGLHIDPNNQQMKTALNDALSAKNRPAAGGGLFGPDAMLRLAMDPRTRDMLEDQEFQGMLRAIGSNPQLLGNFMQDTRMQLVSEKGWMLGH